MKDAQIEMLKELFRAELHPIATSVTKIETAIYGNGKAGLIDRVDHLEDTQKSIMAKFAGFTVFFGLVFTAIVEGLEAFFRKKIGL